MLSIEYFNTFFYQFFIKANFESKTRRTNVRNLLDSLTHYLTRLRGHLDLCVLFHFPNLPTCTLNLIIVVWPATGARFSPITFWVKDVVFRSYL